VKSHAVWILSLRLLCFSFLPFFILISLFFFLLHFLVHSSILSFSRLLRTNHYIITSKLSSNLRNLLLCTQLSCAGPFLRVSRVPCHGESSKI
jgi:hypothetical protein